MNLYYLNFSLRIPLVNESTEIRAATLRTIRHLTTTSEAARAISTLNIHYLISRCLDIELDNKIERLQALKLCRILTFINQGQSFPLILLRSLVAIAEEGKKKEDRYGTIHSRRRQFFTPTTPQPTVVPNGENPPD